MRSRLLNIFDLLLHAFGSRHWWPGDSPLEIAVGAILTQNTAWKNVEKAITNMKDTGMLDVRKLRASDPVRLAEIIRPAGFYRVKTTRLKAFVDFLGREYEGFVENMKDTPTADLRGQLLGINGIGPETADSILLYALGRPVFVVDAYTVRFLRNHGIYKGTATYDDAQSLFMRYLPPDTYLFNEFHALIVYLCQNFCKKRPVCAPCPLDRDRESRQRGGQDDETDADVA
jgi:endonuclease III related protein